MLGYAHICAHRLTTSISLGGRDPSRLPIEVHLDSAGTSRYTGVVRLCGEHDLATAADIQYALASVWGDVLVDLTSCEFIDSTVIGTLIRDHQARRREGHRLELLVPPENTTITRTLTIVGVLDALTTDTRSEHSDAAGPPT
jgi:anti-anti-sigma factor